MNEPYTPLLALHAELSDEAAAKLIEVLYELVCALQSRYASQLKRYYRPPDDEQLDLWHEHLDLDDDGPPF